MERPNSHHPSRKVEASRGPREHGPSYGWQTNVCRPHQADTAEDLADLLEGLADRPHYDGNEEDWDRLLQLLRIPLNVQPAVAIVLAQGRWRNAQNPRAYVATVVWRLGLKLHLRDFGGAKAGPGAAAHQAQSPPYSAHGQGLFEEDLPIIPEWLQDQEEYDKIDWHVVAKHAVRKPWMVPSLALTLELRYDLGLHRDEAIRVGRNRGKQYHVEAAWKWIDRNLQGRIAPLFKLEKAPNLAASEPPGRSRKPMSPWEAIRQACAREKPDSPRVQAPSIMQPGNTPLHRYTILLPGTRIWRRNRHGIIDHTPYRTYDCEWEDE